LGENLKIEFLEGLGSKHLHFSVSLLQDCIRVHDELLGWWNTQSSRHWTSADCYIW